MKKFLLLLSFCFVFQNLSFSQENIDIQGFKIGITPSALLNGWIGFQGVASYTKKRIGIELNAGYLKGSNNSEPYSGYRIRPVVKYFFSEIDDGTFYFGFGYLYRKLNIDASGTFGRFNNAYFQEIDFKINQSMSGLYAMFGMLVPLRNDRFFLDVGLGFGNSALKTKHLNVPSDATLFYSPPVLSSDTRSAGQINYPIVFGNLALKFKF